MADHGINEQTPRPRKSHKRLPGRAAAETRVHFGLTVRSGSRHGLHIDRETYALISKRSSTWVARERNPAWWDATAHMYEDEDHRIHTDEWCAEQQAQALENFDLNMTYFARLDHAEFDQAITKAVGDQRGMVEVTDLNDWDGKQGLYVMVLDDHIQAYVGIAESDGGIKTRIRQHWSRSKEFDRLLWGDVSDSIISIDSFRALDTTRIFAARARNPLRLENKVIEAIPAKFLLNRTAGGGGRMLDFDGALAGVMKRRELWTEPPGAGMLTV